MQANWAEHYLISFVNEDMQIGLDEPNCDRIQFKYTRGKTDSSNCLQLLKV